MASIEPGAPADRNTPAHGDRHTPHKLRAELERLAAEERALVQRLIQRHRVARNVAQEFRSREGLGGRVADKVAAVGGSWGFLISFLLFLVAWMVLNSLVLAKAFDPYPYILLNLCLSCVAAVQAPIIMMSQNRQATIDRMRAENDYQVNVKAELEILQVHEKLDRLREQDWAQLVEQQREQIQMLQLLCERLIAAPAASAAPAAPGASSSQE